MIRASPSLNTLKLEIYHNRRVRSDNLGLASFFGSLNTIFPNSRHFEHLASSHLDIGLVGDPSRRPGAVRSFFLQYPSIETLALDWAPKFSLTKREAEAIHNLFPALRHFSGPDWTSSVLVRTPLRFQLESLDVLPSWDIMTHSYARVTNSIIELLRLRHLTFPADDIYEDSGSPWGHT